LYASQAAVIFGQLAPGSKIALHSSSPPRLLTQNIRHQNTVVFNNKEDIHAQIYPVFFLTIICSPAGCLPTA
jgi:hypothetical protein